MDGNTFAKIITIFIVAMIIILFFKIIFGVIKVIVDKKERNDAIENLYNYESVVIGMPLEEMLDIMGDDYNLSSLKNNRQKYEWRVNSISKPKYGNSIEYSGVKKVVIYVKNGVVEEIRPYNV